MKKALFAMLVTCLCLFAVAGWAEGEQAEIVFQKGFSVPADATTIDFGSVRIQQWDKLIPFLKQFPNLERVDMYETPLSAKRIRELAETFPEVTFGWTMALGSSSCRHWVRTDATAFSTKHGSASETHGSEAFEPLKYCTQLLALDIGHNKVEDLSFLYDLPELRVLIIGRNNVKDLTPVGSLKHLEYLEMFSNRVADLTPLANCTELLDLNICYNRISDVSALTGLKKLGRLWMRRADYYTDYLTPELSEEQVESLRAALPDTKIDTVSEPTHGQWRTDNDKDDGVKSPHYAVIHQMFKEGRYIPFEESMPTD